MSISAQHASPTQVVLVALLALTTTGPSQASSFVERQILSITASQAQRHFDGMDGFGIGWRGNDRVAGVPMWWSAETSIWLRQQRRSWRVTAGPIFSYTVNMMGVPLDLEGAIRLTYIDHLSFQSEDLGSSHVLFASHAGVAWWAPAHEFAVGLRIEHVSNAGMSKHNPGVNFASVELQVPLTKQ